jgi:hypothetical protein
LIFWILKFLKQKNVFSRPCWISKEKTFWHSGALLKNIGIWLSPQTKTHFESLPNGLTKKIEYPKVSRCRTTSLNVLWCGNYPIHFGLV